MKVGLYIVVFASWLASDVVREYLVHEYVSWYIFKARWL